ncbi:hypothetical protein ES703_50945 [subsurface metagenome]
MKELDKLKKSSCTCKECISYCEKTPGWFRPKEIPLLAEFLELPIVKVFEKYLIADFWIGDEKNIYVLSPVKDLDHSELPEHELITIQKEHNELLGRDRDKAGKRASWGYAFIYAPCIFLKDDRCTIYPVRPFECAIANHNETPKNIRELISREWHNNHLIETLLTTKGTKKEKQ